MPVVIPVKENGEWRAKMKPGGWRCPHLSYNGSIASCAVHEESIYRGSPCWIYGNSEADPDHAANPTRPCMVGKYHQEAGGLQNSKLVQLGPPPTMEDCGLWPET